MATTNETTATTTWVAAEDAPLGVRLWPTSAPEFDRNFTLRTVSVTRSSYGQYVIWEYENGGTRDFALGENVAVQYPEGHLAGLVTYVVGQRVAFTDPTTKLVTAGTIDQVLSVDDGIYLVDFDGDGSVAAFAYELEPADAAPALG